MLSFNLKLCLDFTFLLRYHSLCKFDLLFKALMRISYQSTKQIETFFSILVASKVNVTMFSPMCFH